MPLHASYLLQPLDVGCFTPLKKAYGRQTEHLVRNHINHIMKLEFLPAFKAAFDNSITKNNICASFRGAGLMPYDPEAVLAKLDVKLLMPSPQPLLQAIAQWESKTPSNAAARVMHSSVLLRDQVASLQKANEAAIKRKERKKSEFRSKEP
jgi:hypothetical protein